MSIKNLPADYLLAAQQGDIDKVKTCLALGVDINTCDRQGKTAITLASLYQQYACVQALIDAGADINKQDHTCLNPFLIREGANKQVISSQVDSLIKISRIWADFFPANTSNQPI
ncbi:ankyrin repeat domain-containing protein, partial [Escherichia coli]|uniref:ankyrin repeat domain-containing protein n=2 Tax=Enterobacteriaceae TaxID=543 RepID=UPI0021C1EB1B